MGTTFRTATGWEAKFAGALYAAMTKAGCVGAVEDLKWDRCAIDRTWGDKDGLVFYGSTPEMNERAAKFFETWAGRNLRKMNVVGGYDRQEAIAYVGEFQFTRFENGAQGWHRKRGAGEPAYSTKLLETREGYATSFVYYPCAD